MFDVLLRSAVTGGYDAHKFVLARLDAIGVKMDTRDFLFCIDPLATDRIVLRTGYQIAAALGEVRQLPTITHGNEYHFCVRVSPMKRDRKGRRTPAFDLEAWREQHLAEPCGVMVNKVLMRSTMTFCTKDKGFWLPDVVMVGRLQITDPMKVIKTMQIGVGRHRAFGFGLLQLFPVEN